MQIDLVTKNKETTGNVRGVHVVRTYQTNAQLSANLTETSIQCRPVPLISVSAILLAGYRIVNGMSKINYNFFFQFSGL